MGAQKRRDAARSDDVSPRPNQTKPKGGTRSTRITVRGTVISLTSMAVPAAPTRAFDFNGDDDYHRLLWRLLGHRLQTITFFSVVTHDNSAFIEFVVDSDLGNINVRSQVSVSYRLDDDYHPLVLSVENLRTKRTWKLPRKKRK